MVSKLKEAAVQESVLTKAHNIIYGDREKTYGTPSGNLQTIADYWTIHLRRKHHLTEDELKLDVDDVCGMMILMKQARLANTPDHLDSLVDICGYAALQERCK